LTILPARSEVFRKIAINATTWYVYIPNQEVQNGVFIGNSIADSKNTFVEILNTTDKSEIIHLNELKIEPLDDNDIVKTNKDKFKTDILSKLNKNLLSHFKTILNELCTKYMNIFGIETE